MNGPLNKTVYGRKKRGGYVLLLAVLISSIILSISLSVYSLGLKQFLLSAFLSDSQKALAAADRGIECFMYWDALFRDPSPPYDTTNDTSAIATLFRANSSEVFPQNAGNADVGVCSGTKINTTPFWVDGTKTFATAGSAQTSFNLQFSDNTCVEVTVVRDSNLTRVTADGFSDCNPNNLRRTQRRLEAVASI